MACSLPTTVWAAGASSSGTANASNWSSNGGSSTLAVSTNVQSLPLVVDNAGLLSSTDQAKLEQQLEQISNKQQCQVIVLTTNSLSGKSPMNYADDYFDNHSYGYGANKDGLLLLVSMTEQEFWISTSGFAIQVFAEDGESYLMSEVTSNLSSGNYYTAFSRFANNANSLLSKYHSGEPVGEANKPSSLQNLVNLLPLGAGGSLGLGALVGWGVAFALKSRNRTVMANQGANIYLKAVSGVTEGGSEAPQNAFGLYSNNFNGIALSQLLNLSASTDNFLFSNITSIPIAPSNNSLGGGGVHTSSGGGVHGGFGGKF